MIPELAGGIEIKTERTHLPSKRNYFLPKMKGTVKEGVCLCRLFYCFIGRK